MFRKKDREFTETLFKNAEQQKSAGSLGSEIIKEYLVDRTGEILPIKFELTALQIDHHGLPVVQKEKVNLVLDCGHRACSLKQVLGRCSYGHTVCSRCQLYTCASCGEKICELDVLRLEDDSTVCIEHEKEIMIERIKIGTLEIAGNTLKYLCGWVRYEDD